MKPEIDRPTADKTRQTIAFQRVIFSSRGMRPILPRIASSLNGPFRGASQWQCPAHVGGPAVRRVRCPPVQAGGVFVISLQGRCSEP